VFRSVFPPNFLPNSLCPCAGMFLGGGGLIASSVDWGKLCLLDGVRRSLGFRRFWLLSRSEGSGVGGGFLFKPFLGCFAGDNEGVRGNGEASLDLLLVTS